MTSNNNQDLPKTTKVTLNGTSLDAAIELVIKGVNILECFRTLINDRALSTTKITFKIENLKSKINTKKDLINNKQWPNHYSDRVKGTHPDAVNDSITLIITDEISEITKLITELETDLKQQYPRIRMRKIFMSSFPIGHDTILDTAFKAKDYELLSYFQSRVIFHTCTFLENIRKHDEKTEKANARKKEATDKMEISQPIEELSIKIKVLEKQVSKFNKLQKPAPIKPPTQDIGESKPKKSNPPKKSNLGTGSNRTKINVRKN